MVVEHGEVAFTHPPHDPQLWLETRATDGLDKNRVYGKPMASIWYIRSSHIISTISTQYSNPSYFINLICLKRFFFAVVIVVSF
jgi:hypothetical protein